MARGNDELLKVAEDIARDVATLARIGTANRFSSTVGGGGGGGAGGGLLGGAARRQGSAGPAVGGLAGKLLRGGVQGLALGAVAAAGTVAVRAGAAGISASVDGALNLGLNAEQSLTAGLLAGASKIPFIGARVARETAVEKSAADRTAGITAGLARAGASSAEIRPLREFLFEAFSAEEFRASQEAIEVDRLRAQRGNPRSLRRAIAGRTYGPEYGPEPSQEILRAVSTGRMGNYRRGSE